MSEVSAGGPSLAVTGMVKRFGGLTAIDDLSLAVSSGAGADGSSAPTPLPVTASTATAMNIERIC